MTDIHVWFLVANVSDCNIFLRTRIFHLFFTNVSILLFFITIQLKFILQTRHCRDEGLLFEGFMMGEITHLGVRCQERPP